MNHADDTHATGDAKTQARAWLVRLRSGDATEEDLHAYRRWCAEHPEHAPGVQLMGDAWSTLREVAAQIIEEHPEEHPDAAFARLRKPASHPLRPGRRAFVGFAVAAGASWLALRPPLQLWPALADFAVDYRTGTGEQRQVALSDRLMVQMNTQTRINVLPTSTGQVTQHGIDLLAGEAEVVAALPPLAASSSTFAGRATPVRPVVVVAGRGRLQADVAHFDIRRTGNQVCVTCISGSVAFEHPQRRLTLLASQQVIYDDRDVQPISQVDPAAVTAWRRGVLLFNGVPLEQVVDEINRYRPGKLILRTARLSRSKVQAQIYTSNLDGAIDMLGSLYHMDVVKLPGNITLLG
jgi:transmembrane sensor